MVGKRAEIVMSLQNLKSAAKARIKKQLLKTIWSFDATDLKKKLWTMGVVEGDLLMVHSSWKSDSGFKGSLQDLVQAFMDTVGPRGTVCMMSMPFNGMTAAKYLEQGKVFDVRKTVSKVGLPSDIFRRRKDVVRSLHPTHSVAAWGGDAEWLVEGHENCISPFGANSPFDKIVRKNGKIVMYDVPFNTLTLEHYIEDQIKNDLPFNLYDDKIYKGACIDQNGNDKEIQTLVLSGIGNEYRNSLTLKGKINELNALTEEKLGRVNLCVIYTSMIKTNMTRFIDNYSKM